MTETAPPPASPATVVLALLVATAVGVAFALAPELLLTWAVTTAVAVGQFFFTTAVTVFGTLAGLVGAA